MKSAIFLLLLFLLPLHAAPALLGVRAVPTHKSVQQSFADSIPAGEGLTIISLAPGSPAAEHLLPGDVLLKADGRPLSQPEDLSELVRNKQAGDSLRVELLRLGSRMELLLTLASRPEPPQLTHAQQSEINKLLLLLVPTDDSPVDVPAVRRHMLELSRLSLASSDEYGTCMLYLSTGTTIIIIKSSERSLSIRSNAPAVPDALLRADHYKRDVSQLPEKLEQLLLNAEYYHP